MPRSAFSPLSFSVLAVLALAQTAGGQGTITLAAGVGGPALVAPGAKLAVPIAVDMTAATAGTNLASLTSMASWSATRLTLDSVTAGTFGSLTSNVTSGSATLSLFSGSGTTTSVTIGTLYFTASATAGGTQIRLTPSVAGDELGASILPLLRTRNLDVCVSMSGLWGDANGDLTVNIIDAQQIARFSVGLTVANATAIAAQGDVTGDNQVNIIDAQQIARFSVGLTAAARVNTTIALTPAVASVTVPLAAGSVQVGQTAQLTATPLDASDLPLTGCSPVSWSSSDAAKATVNSSGVVTGVAPGAVTITATAGGQTAQIGVNVGIGTVPASMAIVQGNGQYRRGGTSYGVNPGVRVLDAQQRAVPSVAVTFSAVAGPSVTALTDSTGLAQAVGWTGGGNSVPVEVDGGGTQLATTTTFTAASAGLASVTFTGTGLNSEVGATACLLTTAGATYCQGEYESTNLTDRASSDTLLGRLPVLVANGVPLASLSPTVYGEFSCGVAAGGQGYCWGWNQAGQLGADVRAVLCAHVRSQRRPCRRCT